jgi:hypothetical protein
MHGLSTMHGKGYAYNVLTPAHIFVTIEGGISIDTAKAKPSGKLSGE